jgi:hypothetical protein
MEICMNRETLADRAGMAMRKVTGEGSQAGPAGGIPRAAMRAHHAFLRTADDPALINPAGGIASPRRITTR